MKQIYFILLFLWCQQAQAQTCVDNYFVTTYKGANSSSIASAVANTKGEVVCAGSIDYNNLSFALSDGWLTKFSAQGTVLWSKRYQVFSFTYVQFSDVVQASDESYIAVGAARDTIGRTSSQLTRVIGVILHIDKYGNVLQSLSLDNDYGIGTEKQTEFFSITKTNDGDFVIGGFNSFQGKILTQAFLLRIDAAGHLKWLTQFYAPDFSFVYISRNAALQIAGNKIVAAFPMSKRDPPNYTISKMSFYLFCLDLATGARLWDKTYVYSSNPQGVAFNPYAISAITQLSNGDLSFLSSYSDSTTFGSPPYAKTGLRLVTDINGGLKKSIAYYNTQPGCRTADAGKAQTLLLDDGSHMIRVKLDETGKVQEQQAYNGLSGTPVAVALIEKESGENYLFANDQSDPTKIHMYKTDAGHAIACAAAPVQMVSSDVTSGFWSYESGVQVLSSEGAPYPLPYIRVFGQNYPLTTQVDCRKACCTSKTDTAAAVNQCDAEAYTLPNNDIVKESGTYYVNYKTAKGCDSIVFYPVNFFKTPWVNLGPDDCLGEDDSVLLKATGGYEMYNWMGAITTDSTYSVTKPGIYWVAVSNSCGIKKDSIEIFRQCDFPVYMPSAFTPDGDGLNDQFNLPTQNKNTLILLTIYNRWGQPVFRTNNNNQGWNGTYKNKQQPAGTYVYTIITQTLNNKRIVSNGTVMLIR